MSITDPYWCLSFIFGLSWSLYCGIDGCEVVRSIRASAIGRKAVRPSDIKQLMGSNFYHSLTPRFGAKKTQAYFCHFSKSTREPSLSPGAYSYEM
jgi:hypothetical protein